MQPLVTGNIIEALIEALFFGLYFILFTTTIYLFRRKHGLPPRHRPALCVLLGLTLQFLAVTSHWAITMYRTIYALGTLTGHADTLAFYANLAHPAFVANVALLVITHMITDAFVLHRLYVIFSHEKKVMVFPGACFVVQVVCATALVVRGGTSKAGEDYLTLSNGWLTSKLITSILISLYSSTMITLKIFRVQRAFSGKHGGPANLTSLLGILVESAALQLAIAILMLCSFQFKWLAGEFISTGTGAAAFAISTVLIHARIGLGWTAMSCAADSSASAPVRVNFPSPRPSASARSSQSGSGSTDVSFEDKEKVLDIRA
ncbi:hypothetical protein MKEN_01108000 [Mycena kentingensis (nom. inval.)]|nr:hypothetical protein MKEN_01108000 [Mycena kentingensis (nom. inval.)]